MLKLFSKNYNHFLLLNKQEALSLELKLNISKYGEEWSKLGDILYKYSISFDENLVYEIEYEQLIFLLSIRENLSK